MASYSNQHWGNCSTTDLLHRSFVSMRCRRSIRPLLFVFVCVCDYDRNVDQRTFLRPAIAATKTFKLVTTSSDVARHQKLHLVKTVLTVRVCHTSKIHHCKDCLWIIGFRSTSIGWQAPTTLARIRVRCITYRGTQGGIGRAIQNTHIFHVLNLAFVATVQASCIVHVSE